MAQLVPRSDTTPPRAQTRIDVNPTLIVSWFCTIFSLVIILIRIFGRWIRTERLFKEDKFMLWALIPLMIRMAFVHAVLIFGTNNTQTEGLTEQDIYNRSIGSRLVLLSRIFYAVYIWVAKVTVLEFVQRITATSWTKFYMRGAILIYSFLGLTLVAVIISTLAECQPFDHYWQVVPDPGSSCRSAEAQLITMGSCDITTDVVLMVFPIPLVLTSKMRLTKKISMVLLFLLSLILIAITAYRIPSTRSRHYAQQYRSLLASLEILAATFVSNTVVIASFIKDKGVKKFKYKADDTVAEDDDDVGSMLTRPATRQTKPSVAQRHWGSDEDLVRDFGLSLPTDLRRESVAIRAARLAPIAEPPQIPYRDISSPEPTINPQGRGLLDPGWTFRKGSNQRSRSRRDSDSSLESDSSMDFKLQKLERFEPYHDEPTSPGAIAETKKLGFFDVGGLVETNASEDSSIERSSRRFSNALSAGPVSRSGQNFISDVGGLLSPQTNETQRSNGVSSTHSNNSAERNSRPDHVDTIRRSTSLLHERNGTHAAQRNETVHNDSLPSSQDDGPDSLDFVDAGNLLK